MLRLLDKDQSQVKHQLAGYLLAHVIQLFQKRSLGQVKLVLISQKNSIQDLENAGQEVLNVANYERRVNEADSLSRLLQIVKEDIVRMFHFYQNQRDMLDYSVRYLGQLRDSNFQVPQDFIIMNVGRFDDPLQKVIKAVKSWLDNKLTLVSHEENKLLLDIQVKTKEHQYLYFQVEKPSQFERAIDSLLSVIRRAHNITTIEWQHLSDRINLYIFTLGASMASQAWKKISAFLEEVTSREYHPQQCSTSFGSLQTPTDNNFQLFTEELLRRFAIQNQLNLKQFLTAHQTYNFWPIVQNVLKALQVQLRLYHILPVDPSQWHLVEYTQKLSQWLQNGLDNYMYKKVQIVRGPSFLTFPIRHLTTCYDDFLNQAFEFETQICLMLKNSKFCNISEDYHNIVEQQKDLLDFLKEFLGKFSEETGQNRRLINRADLVQRLLLSLSNHQKKFYNRPSADFSKEHSHYLLHYFYSQEIQLLLSIWNPQSGSQILGQVLNEKENPMILYVTQNEADGIELVKKVTRVLRGITEVYISFYRIEKQLLTLFGLSQSLEEFTRTFENVFQKRMQEQFQLLDGLTNKPLNERRYQRSLNC